MRRGAGCARRGGLRGARLGGGFKTTEEKLQSVPFLGNAIVAARKRSLDDFNRVAAARALAPIGETPPDNVTTGHDLVGYTAGKLGEQYDRAGQLVSNLAPDQAFGVDVAGINKNLMDYPLSTRQQFADILQNRVVDPLASGSGSGDQFIGITSQIRKLQNRYGRSVDGADQGLADALDGLHVALGDLASRQNPAYGPAKQAADAGWATFKQYQKAASSQGASEDGLFTPQQYKGAVRASDPRVDKGGFAEGTALNQDLASQGQSVLGNNYPDSGTSGRELLSLAALGVTDALTGGHPAALIPGVALGASPALYWGQARGGTQAIANADPNMDLAAAIAERAKGLGAQDPKKLALSAWLPALIQGSQAIGAQGVPGQ